MTTELAEIAVVMVGENIAVAQFDQRWMTQHGILLDVDKEPGFFTPFAVQQRTSQYELLVMPNRIQLAPTPTTDLDKACELLNKGASALLEADDNMLPLTAIGINLGFIVYGAADENLRKANSSLLSLDSGIPSLFDTADSRFGVTARKLLDGLQVNLDLQPILRSDKAAEGFLAKLNYHRDVKSKEEARELLSKIKTLKDFARSVIGTVEKLIAPTA